MAPTTPTPSNSNEFIEEQLDIQIERIEDCFDAHAIAFNGPLIAGVDSLVRSVVERRASDGRKKKKLVCVLTTDGGYVEVVRRIVDVFRRHYSLVDFVIPDYAYSAGTILAMSGDAIHMDYYSRLGPIDPQIPGRDGSMLPALGYLERYNDLIEKASDPKRSITMAEVQLLIDGFDQAELYKYDQARELSVTLLEEWLAKYKFKDWKTTRTRGQKVTPTMKKQRAKEIAEILNDTKKWHSHGNGISRDVLTHDLNMIIDDFEEDAELNDRVRCYYALHDDYMTKLAHRGSIHARENYSPFFYKGGA